MRLLWPRSRCVIHETLVSTSSSSVLVTEDVAVVALSGPGSGGRLSNAGWPCSRFHLPFMSFHVSRSPQSFLHVGYGRDGLENITMQAYGYSNSDSVVQTSRWYGYGAIDHGCNWGRINGYGNLHNNAMSQDRDQHSNHTYKVCDIGVVSVSLGFFRFLPFLLFRVCGVVFAGFLCCFFCLFYIHEI